MVKKARKRATQQQPGIDRSALLAIAHHLTYLANDCYAGQSTLSAISIPESLRSLSVQLKRVVAGESYSFLGLRSVSGAPVGAAPEGEPWATTQLKSLAQFLAQPAEKAVSVALRLLSEHKDACEELERTRVQLAGCLSAAEGHLEPAAKQGDYGWSPAYQAVAVLRQVKDRLVKELAEVRMEASKKQSQYLIERRDYERHARVVDIIKTIVYPDVIEFKVEVRLAEPTGAVTTVRDGKAFHASAPENP